jgi:hypothetical protein
MDVSFPSPVKNNFYKYDSVNSEISKPLTTGSMCVSAIVKYLHHDPQL